MFCDQTTAGGGWTVFQKRIDGSIDFYRGWADYKNGFGDLNGEFWLGLDKIRRLTKTTKNRLRVDLEDTTGKSAYAEYDMFAVTSERSKYQLSLGTYSAGQSYSLSISFGFSFSSHILKWNLIVWFNMRCTRIFCELRGIFPSSERERKSTSTEQNVLTYMLLNHTIRHLLFHFLRHFPEVWFLGLIFYFFIQPALHENCIDLKRARAWRKRHKQNNSNAL